MGFVTRLKLVRWMRWLVLSLSKRSTVAASVVAAIGIKIIV